MARPKSGASRLFLLTVAETFVFLGCFVFAGSSSIEVASPDDPHLADPDADPAVEQLPGRVGERVDSDGELATPTLVWKSPAIAGSSGATTLTSAATTNAAPKSSQGERE